MAPVTSASFQEAVDSTANMKQMIKSPNVVEKCAAMCVKYDITEADLIGRIDAFLTNEMKEELSLETFGRFEQEINRQSNKQARNPTSMSSSAHTATKPPLAKRALDTPSPAMAAQNKRAHVSFATPDEIGKTAKIPFRHGEEASPGTSQSPTIFAAGSSSDNAAGNENAGVVPRPIHTYKNRPNVGVSMATLNPSLGMRGEFEPSERKPLGKQSVQLSSRNPRANTHLYPIRPLSIPRHAVQDRNQRGRLRKRDTTLSIHVYHPRRAVTLCGQALDRDARGHVRHGFHRAFGPAAGRCAVARYRLGMR